MRDNPDTDAQTKERRSIKVEISTKRWGSDNSPSIKVIDVPVFGESKIRLDITVDLRQTDTVEIRPVRRALEDVEGLVADAERLANS